MLLWMKESLVVETDILGIYQSQGVDITLHKILPETMNFNYTSPTDQVLNRMREDRLKWI